ncbi:Ribosome-binding protein 1 [Durusdinium trenchii]|uniref:Ribosome-binding protein 1 n=1 Tax=Durusdinium trenchii TaxID=1381693 RepID=A0ABP0NIE6_9DINO
MSVATTWTMFTDWHRWKTGRWSDTGMVDVRIDDLDWRARDAGGLSHLHPAGARRDALPHQLRVFGAARGRGRGGESWKGVLAHEHLHLVPEPHEAEPVKPILPSKKAVEPLAEPLLNVEDLEKGLDPSTSVTVPEESVLWAWIRTLLLALAGLVLWVFPERWASVFLLLAALWVAPFLGPALRGGLPLPHVGLRRMVASGLVDFAGKLGHEVLKDKSQWLPPVIDAVGEVVPPALSRVMEKKEEWTPALTQLVGDVVPSVMRGVLTNHRAWSPALMQLVGDVVPPVLSSVLRNREWTPALLEFVGEVVPPVITVVLQRPELPPAIAGFVDSAGPSLAPAVVRLIDFIIMDPQLMQSIKKMTDSSMRDEALVSNIKLVIEESLKEGTMYRAVGHGLKAAAEQSVEKMGRKARSMLSS